MQGTKVYKLTDQQGKTQGLQWIPGEWHSTSGVGTLCSASFLHAYPSALCSIFMNPIHARIQLPKLWIAEALGASKEDAGLKVGFSQLRIVEEILPPLIDQEHRIRLGLLASLEICSNPQWIAYAQNYLTGNSITFRDANVKTVVESNEERDCRTYAWKAALYEDVESGSALAMQIACQYKSLNAEGLFQQAWGGVFLDTPAAGRSRETTAFRSAPHD
jgi:hypothetical protein